MYIPARREAIKIAGEADSAVIIWFRQVVISRLGDPDSRFPDHATMNDPDRGGSRRGAMAGLAVAVVLLVVALWLAHALTATSKMQDCLMSGRTNCNVIPAQ